MKKNMGNTDRTIRTLIAVAFALLFIGKVVTGIAGIIMLVLAIVFVVTSLIGYCPLYSLLRINSNKTQKPV